MSRQGKAFAANEPVLLIDKKERRHYTILEPGKTTNFRGDYLPHDEIIGQMDGVNIYSQRKQRFRVFRPTLDEQVRLMPRGAQVIYPKDIAMIIMHADVFPGARVVECGLGSGALTSGLLRAVGSEGQVTSYEIRTDFINNARKNLQAFFGETPNHIIKEQDIYERFDDHDADRLILDVPEPWRAIEQAAPVLRPGAIVCSYSPTILQVKTFVDTLHRLRLFTDIYTFETFLREWKVDSVSVRPELRMVAHTAFLTTARVISPGAAVLPKDVQDGEAEDSSQESENNAENEPEKAEISDS